MLLVRTGQHPELSGLAEKNVLREVQVAWMGVWEGTASSALCRQSRVRAVGDSTTCDMQRSFWNQGLSRRQERREHTESHKRFLGAKPGSHDLHFHSYTKGQISRLHGTRLSESLTSVCPIVDCDVKTGAQSLDPRFGFAVGPVRLH